MTKIFTAAIMLAACAVAADTAREQTLQRGIDWMESKGDLAKAMPLFEEAARSSDRGLAARALLYLGQAQERQDQQKARATYERIVREFSDQTETAAAARKYQAALALDQKEEFLRTARIVAQRSLGAGNARVTLTDGSTTHDASVQQVNLNNSGFSDSYRYNIAAWKLARLLGIEDMMPPSVARVFEGQSAAFTWWIDDVLMDEGERLKRKQEAPNQEALNREVNVMRVFDQLIFNTDRNTGNLLLDTRWRLWLIDHTRAFRTWKTLPDATVLPSCDRSLLSKMKTLDKSTLKKEIGAYLLDAEIDGLLARRDLLVKFFEAKGESGLFDRPKRD
jgi:hypothetical protein